MTSIVTHRAGASRLAALALFAATAATLAACGSGTTSKAADTPEPSPTSASAPASVEPTPTAEPITSPNAPTATQAANKPASTGLSRAAAIAHVKKKGYDAQRADETYVAGRKVNVIVGVFSESATSHRQKAFFFIDGKPIGTDTRLDSAGIQVITVKGNVATLRYALYDATTPMCCPAGFTTVRYQWSGSTLTPLDPIPPTINEAKKGQQYR
jgi:pyruvate/2-oxoglutarate dehydrogenase complex dihydrolipoamide acyltransferase (E2) component